MKRIALVVGVFMLMLGVASIQNPTIQVIFAPGAGLFSKSNEDGTATAIGWISGVVEATDPGRSDDRLGGAWYKVSTPVGDGWAYSTFGNAADVSYYCKYLNVEDGKYYHFVLQVQDYMLYEFTWDKTTLEPGPWSTLGDASGSQRYLAPNLEPLSSAPVHLDQPCQWQGVP
jgi:hypothetical protein